MGNVVLVTGGAGYLPVSLDSMVSGHRWAVRWGDLVQGDILDAGTLDEVFSRYRRPWPWSISRPSPLPGSPLLTLGNTTATTWPAPCPCWRPCSATEASRRALRKKRPTKRVLFGFIGILKSERSKHVRSS